MKKLAILLTAVLLLTVFAGCQRADNGSPRENTSASAEPAVQLPLTRQTAIEVAFGHAGVTNDQVQHLHAREDTDNGAVHFDVDFRHGDYYYAYEISQQTGEIFKLETEYDRAEPPLHQITGEEAQAIALAYEGFTSDSVQRLKTEFDREDHRYEVEFHKDGVEYTYEICAEFGKILDIDKDLDD